MSIGAQSVLLNALPLLLLASVYFAVTAALAPAVWRDRAHAHPVEVAVVAVFPAIGAAATMFGALVLYDRRPLGGHVWFSFAAILVALVPALLFVPRWRDRALVVGGVRRLSEAEERVSLRDRELGVVASISNALARARDPEGAARPLVRQVQELLGVDFAAVAVVDEDGETATGIHGQLGGADVDWWPGMRVDLRGEPSGIASAVLEGAPVAVYDVASSVRVSPRLAERLGAKSGVWVPLITEERVIGVLVASTTREQHAFAPEEIALLQALAGEAALALERLRSAEALEAALAREQLVAEIARKVHGELDVDEVVRVASEQVRDALQADSVTVALADDEPLAAGGVSIHVERVEPLGEGERLLVEAVAREVGVALRNAEMFGERARQERIQRAFYRIASLLGEPLSLAETLDATAQAAVEALGGDFGAVVVPERTHSAVVGAYELPDALRGLAVPAALSDAARDGRVVAAPRAASDDRLDEAWRRGPFASVLAIPVEGAAAGLVVVFFRDERAFTDDDLELARQLASAAHGALERSRLYEAERSARSLAQQLARTGSLLATELDPAAVLQEVVEQATTLLGADAGALASLEDDELVVSAAVGDGAEEAVGMRSAATGWLGGDVIQSRGPVAYEDASTDPGLVDSDAVLASGYRAYLGVPLAGPEGALYGVLAVYDLGARLWREEEIDALGALAANAAAALSTAELYQRVAVEREQSVAILANIADGIVAVDRDGHVVVWNAAAEQITGVPAAEAHGRTPAQVLQRDLESEHGSTNRLVSIQRGSEEVWLSLSEAVMRDPAGAIAGRIFAFRDISAERAVEQMKSDFVSTVSHELRTPLTSIYGFAETLLRRDIEFGEDERRTFLGFIASESERLTRIVDALLNVARLDTGDLQVALEPTDVGAVVADAVSTVEGNGHRFEVAVEDDALRAHADPDKLRQVLDQLVANAVKFSPGGGLVRVEARRRRDGVEISVADEGVGIPASQRERIFSKFYRGGENGPSTGTGLGLFIAQGLVSAMGGRIWVDSEEGRGSRFTFELPAARSE